MSVTLPAVPESVAQARNQVTEFAACAGAQRRHTEAIRLAVSEAISNAVLHAYRDEPGDVHVTAALACGEMWVLVCDDGGGLEVRTDRPGLGLGLALIAQVSEEMSIVPRAGGGTEVRMRFMLVGAVEAPDASSAPSTDMPGFRDGSGDRTPPHRAGSSDRRARRPA